MTNDKLKKYNIELIKENENLRKENEKLILLLNKIKLTMKTDFIINDNKLFF